MPKLAAIARADDVVAMDEVSTRPPPPTPPAVTMWKIKFRGNGDIDLAFTKVFDYTFAQNETITDVVEKVVLGTFPAQNQWKTPQNKEPYKSRLSIENNQHRYQLFVLESGNFHFSVEQVAFSVAEDRRAYYVAPRSAWEQSPGVVAIKRVPPEGVAPRVAFFTARSHQDPQVPAGKAAAFNLHVDLTFPDGTRIPISIDPDVGHPGGYSFPDP